MTDSRTKAISPAARKHCAAGEHLGVKYRRQCVWTYKGKPITNFLSAAYVAFNLVDPVPEVARARGGMLSEGESAPTQDLRR